MKILFLGTSAGWPLPRLGCDCKICTSSDPKDTRLRPAVLVNETILIDAGPDIYHQLINHKVNTRKIKALIITHAHHDHIDGLHDLTHIYNQEKKISLLAKTPTLKAIRKLYHYVPLSFEVKSVKQAPNKLQLATFKVDHSKSTDTYGVKLNSLVYIPDFKKIPKKSLPYLKKGKLIVLDGSSLDPNRAPGHSSIKEGLELIKNLFSSRLSTVSVYFTHIGHPTDTHQELEAFVQKKGGKNFHVAYDGLELKI